MPERRAPPIRRKDVDAVAKQKQETSPWMSQRTARRIARDEIRQHPSLPVVQPLTNHIMRVEDKSMQRPKKRKPRPRPASITDMMGWTPRVRYPGN